MSLSCQTLSNPVIISTMLIVSASDFVNMILFSSRLRKKPCVLLLPEVALANQIRACQIQKVLFILCTICSEKDSELTVKLCNLRLLNRCEFCVQEQKMPSVDPT